MTKPPGINAAPGWGLLPAVLVLLTAGCLERPVPYDVAADPGVALEIREGLLAGAAADVGPAAVVQGTGWATLTGEFKFEPGATPRARRPLNVDKERDVCAPGGHPVLDELLLVDSATGGIANVAVYLRGASRVHETAQPGDEERVFDQEKCIFLTHVKGITVGETLLIKNSDPIGHNTNLSAPGMRGAAFNQTLAANSSVTFKPTAEENVPIDVICNIHPWMRAYLLPRNNGYFAVTAPDGTFRIENLPAGEELEFQVWHEHAAGASGALGLDRKDLKWTPRGRFKVTLQENEELKLDLIVPASAFKG